jgi:hypothetical protein
MVEDVMLSVPGQAPLPSAKNSVHAAITTPQESTTEWMTCDLYCELRFVDYFCMNNKVSNICFLYHPLIAYPTRK